MKGAILIISDTFRFDHISSLGLNDVKTPNLDMLVRESTVFNRSYLASYPTVPNRLDIWTGRFMFPYRGWEPLTRNDVVLPQVLGEKGIKSRFKTSPFFSAISENQLRVPCEKLRTIIS